MPKKVWKIGRFLGGLNTNSDPRDIDDNESSALENISIDKPGRIRPLGGSALLQSLAGSGIGLIKGMGLASFKSDYAGADGGSASESPTEYLAIMDADADAKVKVAKRSGSYIGSLSNAINLQGGQGNVEADYFYMDGALRVTDGKFSNTNNKNRWYGYISRTLFDRETIAADWYDVDAKIEKPGSASKVLSTVATGSITDTLQHTHSGDVTTSLSVLDSGGNLSSADGNIYKIIFDATAFSSGINDEFDGTAIITIGKTTDGSTIGGHTETVEIDFSSGGTLDVDTHANVTVTAAIGDWPVDDTNTGGNEGLLIKINLNQGYGGGTFKINNIRYYSGATSGIDHNASKEACVVEAAFASANNAVGWGSTSSYIYDVGVSFIYDYAPDSPLAQESLIRTCNAASDITGGDGHSPQIKMNIKWKDGSGTTWNKRITGMKLYMRQREADTHTRWHPQIVYDFISGKAKTYINGYEIDSSYDGVTGELSWDMPRQKLLQPNLIDTYESETGVRETEDYIIAKWKTSTVVGRAVYLGGVHVLNEDGTEQTHSDRMIKCIPNKFDLFPSSQQIDVAINDGDDIVKLESFADRILQFKKNILHVINVARGSEALERSYEFKGALHKCSVAKTDFGIAWANEYGCYLYDGRKVLNLLEKGGKKLISDEDWDKFLRSDKTSSGTRLTPMVGYSPKERQIIVFDDVGTGSTAGPNCYVYDLVSGAWTTGTDSTSRIIDVDKSNFINDWDGNLVYLHTNTVNSANHSLRKWDRSPKASTINLITKDIDFGQPGVKKKIYKVYITHRGSTAPTVTYGINGNTNVSSAFSSALQGSSQWTTTELVPAASINDAYSFQLKISGAVSADFEINDISIIFRDKPVR